MEKKDQLNFLQKILSSDDIRNSRTHSQLDKPYSEKYSLIMFASAMIIGGINAFQIKYIKILFPEEYDAYALAFWRSFFFMIMSYYLIYKKKIEILSLKNIQNKFWMAIRTLGQYLAFITYIFCLMHLRISTANCISAMNPAIVVIFSVFILKEKFHVRYILGILICLCGTLMIISNEKKVPIPIEDLVTEDNPNILKHIEELEKQNMENLINMIYGCFYGSLNLICMALLSVSSKILNSENIGYENQCFYIGVSNSICALINISFAGSLKVGMGFIIWSGINSFTLLVTTILQIEAIKGVDLNKTTPLVYLSTLTVFIMGVTFLGETIYFTDILGSLIILGYNVYNSFYPIK